MTDSFIIRRKTSSFQRKARFVKAHNRIKNEVICGKKVDFFKSLIKLISPLCLNSVSLSCIARNGLGDPLEITNPVRCTYISNIYIYIYCMLPTEHIKFRYYRGTPLMYYEFTSFYFFWLSLPKNTKTM